MSKPKATTVDEVDPLAAPEDASDLPAAWERPEGESLPAIPDRSAPLERSDFLTPKLHLVQRVGDLSVNFLQGSWVLNKELQLTEKVGESLNVIILEHPLKFFIEHLPFDPAGPRSRTFHTVEEVEAAGLSLEWDNKNNIRATCDRAARVLLLILKPEALDSENGFGMTVEGIGPCALASWLLVNTSYATAAKRIFTAEKLDLNGKSIYSLQWTLKSVSANTGGYNIFVPQIAPSKTLDEGAMNALKSKFSLV